MSVAEKNSLSYSWDGDEFVISANVTRPTHLTPRAGSFELARVSKERDALGFLDTKITDDFDVRFGLAHVNWGKVYDKSRNELKKLFKHTNAFAPEFEKPQERNEEPAPGEKSTLLSPHIQNLFQNMFKLSSEEFATAEAHTGLEEFQKSLSLRLRTAKLIESAPIEASRIIRALNAPNIDEVTLKELSKFYQKFMQEFLSIDAYYSQEKIRLMDKYGFAPLFFEEFFVNKSFWETTLERAFADASDTVAQQKNDLKSQNNSEPFQKMRFENLNTKASEQAEKLRKKSERQARLEKRAQVLRELQEEVQKAKTRSRKDDFVMSQFETGSAPSALGLFESAKLRSQKHKRGSFVWANAVLGLSTPSDPDAAKVRYKELARLWHPDVTNDPQFHDAMALLNEAWHVYKSNTSAKG